MDWLLPPLVALGVWWFGTGVVMLLDGLPRRTFAWSLSLATLLAIGALVCIAHTANDRSVAGAYAGFVCAVTVWAWHELAFLTGWLTGPRKHACSAPLDGPTRFREAVNTILWHELAIIAVGVLIAALCWGRPNPVAAWTFTLLWAMRVSAKLNLFLGVRNRGLEFLPAHLGYIGSYFRDRHWNYLLPWCLLAGGVLAFALFSAAPGAADGQRTALLLVASLLVLALLEHVMMIAPLSPSLLWRWALRSAPSSP